MKKGLVFCGTGVATSTIVINKIKSWLVDNGLEGKLELYQGKVNDAIGRMDEYDVILATTIVPKSMEDKIINAVPLLSGIGADEVYSMILNTIQ